MAAYYKFFKKAISINLSKLHIKISLAFGAFIILLAVILFTQLMVSDLIKREQKLITFYADMYQHYAGLENVDDFLFFMTNINTTISFPVILTDEKDEPIAPFEEWTLNISFSEEMTMKDRREYLNDFIDEMKSSYPPLVVKEGMITTKIYYTNSPLVNYLLLFPLVALIIVFVFIFVGYMAFSNIRKSEEQKVWVGMAKEAAHQLGTPLSSLMAWIEILKINKDEPELIHETIDEMQNDINRLSTIATRFSKIGSMPEKSHNNLSELIEKVSIYFEKRLPHLKRKVDIVRHIDPDIMANINIELFEWVLENLIKNAAEAIEDKKGEVRISAGIASGQKIIITVSDTGKGMNAKQKRSAFNPGFTTKKRGWGLGLSLVRRIVEEYHKGKISIKDSSPGKGTTFIIELPGNEK